MTAEVRLGQVRREQGLTQRELAARAGITQVALSHLETRRAQPRLTTARALAAALGVSVDELWPTSNGKRPV